MHPNEEPSVSVSRRGPAEPGSDARHNLVWVRGEHDIATGMHLSDTIAQASRLDDTDTVVDLSGVTFMDASTIGALIVARNRLRAHSRSLSVRAPSPLARRLLDVCGLTSLVDEPPAPGQPAVAPALGSWVDVPASDRDQESEPAPVTRETASPEAPSSTPELGAEPARSVRPRRTPP